MAEIQTQFRADQVPLMGEVLRKPSSAMNMAPVGPIAQKEQLSDALMGTGVVGKPGFADITEAYESAMQRFPKLRSLNVSVLDSRDRYYKDFEGREHPEYKLETYDKLERDNPNRGTNTIELFKGITKEQEKLPLATMLAGDMLHLAKEEIPEYKKLWLQFARSLTPKQIEKSQEVHADRGDKRAFDKWMDRSWIDALIRGIVVGMVPRDWQKKGFYTDDQIEIGRRMARSLK
tara:strand:+ start:117 stop:815 length:699 start_codon:yes stop_codon:yes gene_type:complete